MHLAPLADLNYSTAKNVPNAQFEGRHDGATEHHQQRAQELLEPAQE
jgi:hypothetical protein